MGTITKEEGADEKAFHDYKIRGAGVVMYKQHQVLLLHLALKCRHP